MPGKNKRTPSVSNPLQLLRGGKAVPNELVRRCIADIQLRRTAELDKRNTTERQMAKHLAKAQGVVKPGTADASQAQSLQGLLGMHQKLAKQKLAVPKFAGELGGLSTGHITVTTVPPFDYGIVIPGLLAGNNPILEANSNKNTGMMNASAITTTAKGLNGGSMYTTLGVYFHPFGPGTLTVHATPRFSFQWWTNSIGANSLVRSFGSGALNVYGVDVANQTTGAVGGIVSNASKNFHLWDENTTDQVGFDFGFDLQAPVSLQVEVNHDLVYLLFVSAEAHVEGIGWPGSLAGSKLSMAVPSITYDFRAQQVFQS